MTEQIKGRYTSSANVDIFIQFHQTLNKIIKTLELY